MSTPRSQSRRREGTGDDSDQERGPNKRRRIALACSTCRCRKSRCDGKRPKCTACESLGFECSYVQSASSSNVIVGKEYLSELEARLESVESKLSALADGTLTPATTTAPQPVGPNADAPGDSIPSSNGMSSQSVHHCSDEAEGNTDGVGLISFADEEEAAFLGPSSNIAFMRHLGPALARISPSGRAEPSVRASVPSRFEGDMVRSSRRASPSKEANARALPTNGDSIFALPPESEVSRLLDIYFSNTGLLFPFVHEQTFRSKYAEIKQKGPSGVAKTWLALLNMVLAFAISTSAQPDVPYHQRQKETDVYYRRSIGLYKDQMLRVSNLEAVQLHLLHSQYLQGSQKSLQTWMVHGLAVKGALQLGLHSRDASATFTPLEREFRKRTWYGCIILDRTLSMTFGRPPSIPEDYIQVELPSPEHLFDLLSVQSTHNNELSLIFYNATINLYSIMNQTIQTCYGNNLGCETFVHMTQKVNRVYALEAQVQEWKASLPEEISIWSGQVNFEASNSPLPRFCIVLSLRFHNLRILVHRPILVEILDTAGGPAHTKQCNPLLQQVGAYNLNCCLESAMEIISIVRSTLRQGHQHLGAWWFTLYYTFNAALAISATIVIRRSYTTSGFTLTCTEVQARESLDAAIEVLTLLDRGNRMVDKCRNHLSGLVAAFNTISTPKQPSLENFSSLLSPPVGSDGMGTTASAMADLNNAFGPLGTSPVGVDLGEFMTDMDTEVLNLFFS